MEDCEIIFLSYIISKPNWAKNVSDRLKPEYITNDFLKRIYEYVLRADNFNMLKMAKDLEIKPSDVMNYSNVVQIYNDFDFDFSCFSLIERYKSHELKKLITEPDKLISKADELKKIEFFIEKEVDESEEYLKGVEDKIAGRPDLRLVKTGFNNIDCIIDGVRDSELCVIGARPAAGKTTIALNIALNMALENEKVLFFSVEMAKIEMHKKLVSSITGISKKQYTRDNYDIIHEASKKIKHELPLKIIDTAGIAIEKIFSIAKQEKERNGLDAVFVDHLGIVTSTKNFKSRYELITYISFQLKVLAKELDVPVIALCQLSRGVEQRELKAPNMADLRDSGSIEQDADKICFIHNPEYYLRQREPDDKTSKEYIEWQDDMIKFKDKARFVIVKNRDGDSGIAKLRPRFEISRFEDRYE